MVLFDKVLDYNGVFIPPPQYNGTSNGEASAGNRTIYEKLFPYLDGSSEATRLPSPVDGEGNVLDLQTVALEEITPEFFLGLHSAHQLELLHRFEGSFVLGDGDGRLDVLMAADKRTVLVLQNLSSADLAGLSPADQEAIVEYTSKPEIPDEVKEGLALAWNVTIGGTVEENRNSATQIIQDAIDDIKANDSSNADDYIAQMELLKSFVDKNALISESNIQAEIDAIVERFTRMHTFEQAITSFDADYSVGDNTMSLDNNETMRAGLQVFLDEEKRVLEAKNERLAQVSVAGVKDLASLISVLQLTYEIQREAEVAISTAELEQLNGLLSDHAEMQRLVNDALKDFSTGEDANEEQRDILGNESVGQVNLIEDDPNLTNKEKLALAMFESSGVTKAHPLETLYGITRPTQNIMNSRADRTEVDLIAKSQSDWNIFQTQISDAVTLVNQQAQILSNDVSTFNQEQNRHFEMANTALKRMMDMINSIARI